MPINPQTKKKEKSTSLVTTLITAFIILSVLPLLLASSFQIILNFQTQQAVIGSQQQQIALKAATEVSTFIEQIIEVLNAVAQVSKPLSTSTTEQQQLLSNLLKHQPAFYEIALTDSQGQELVKLLSPPGSPDFKEGELSNQSESNWFKQVSEKKESYISSVFINNLHAPQITIAIPIKNDDKEFEGALVGVVDLKIMWTLVNSLQIGENGLAYVVDKQGNLLALGNNNPLPVLAQENVSELNEVNEFIQTNANETEVDIFLGINSFLNANTNVGFFESFEQYVVGSHVPLDRPDWAVVIELPIFEAYQQVISDIGRLVIILIAVAILSGGSGVYVSRRLATPLLNLTQTATKIAGGELELKAAIKGPTEITHLAGAFNSMTTQLRDFIDSLEQRVADRTHRLELAANLGEQLSAILELDQLLTELVKQIYASFNYYNVQVYLVDNSTQTLVMYASASQLGTESKTNGHSIPLKSPNNLVAQAAQTAQTVTSDNVQQIKGWLPNPILPNTHAQMAVPIIQDNTVIGILDVQEDKIAGLDESDANLLRSLTSQVAVSLTNARLFEQIQTALSEMEKLYRISRQMVSASTLSDLIAPVVEGVAIPVINRAVLFVYHYDQKGEIESLTMEANWYSGHGTPPTPIGTSYSRNMFSLINLFLSSEPLFFENVQEDKRVDADSVEIFKRLNIKAIIVLPLWTKNHQIGVVLLEGEEAYHFTEFEIKPYLSLAGQLAVAVENQHLFEQTQQRAVELAKAKEIEEQANLALARRSGHLEAAAQVARDITSVLNPKQLLEKVAILISDAFNFYHTGIFLIDEKDEWAVLQAVSSEGGHKMLDRGHRLKVGQEGIVGYVTANNKARIALDVGEDAVHFQTPELPETRSELALPLQVRNRVVGALDVQSKMVAAFSDEDVTILQTMADQIAIAIHNAQLYSQLEERTTKLEKQAVELAKAKESAESANRAKSKFLANISHELRTPLNAILGYTQILIRDKTLTSEQKEGLKIIKQSGDYLLTLINDVLDLSKIETNKIKLHQIEFNLSNFLQKLLTMYQLQAKQKHISFTYQISTPMPIWIQADEKRLRQILLNLLGNAIKFTNEGQVTFNISSNFLEKITNNQQPIICTLRFEISDTGIGIKPEHLKKLFLPFEQVEEIERRDEGTGLGLTISQKLAQLMGSTIQVKSILGQGSTFWLELNITAISTESFDRHTLTQNIANHNTPPQKTPTNKLNTLDDKTKTVAIHSNLVPPPAEEMTALFDLAMMGNMRKIQDWADNIKQMDPKFIPFAHKISQLAKEFKDQQISDLVKQYM